MPVRSYSGAAKATTLSGAVSAGATVINVVDATGWPTGAAGPFVVTIDAGVTTEEKVLVSGRTGNSLSVSARGFDETTASDHGNGARVEHTLSATDIREANAHVNDTSGDPHPQYLTPAEGAALYPTINHGHAYSNLDHSHTYDSVTLKPSFAAADHSHGSTISRSEHTYEFIGSVSATDRRGFYLPAARTLVKAKHRIRTGGPTATWKLTKNGVDIAAWSGLDATTTGVLTDAADQALVEGDLLEVVVTGVNGSSGTPIDLLVTLWFEG